MLHRKVIWCVLSMLDLLYLVDSQPLSATNLQVAHMPALLKPSASSSLLTISPSTPGPVFSWTLAHRDRGQEQSQYQITVYRLVDPGQRLLAWDSGRVNSTLPRGLYSGEPLRSASRYQWNVQWWDSVGLQAPVSSSALFHVGLKDEWNGTQWIEGGSMLRKDFYIEHHSTAIVYVSGVGFFSIDDQWPAGWRERHIGWCLGNMEQRGALLFVRCDKCCSAR